MTIVIGPMDCLYCKREVYWDRVGTSYRLMERSGKSYRKHRCGRKDKAGSGTKETWA